MRVREHVPEIIRGPEISSSTLNITVKHEELTLVTHQKRGYFLWVTFFDSYANDFI